MAFSGVILWMCPANERWRYIVTLSLIGWMQTQNDPWFFNPLYPVKILTSVIQTKSLLHSSVWALSKQEGVVKYQWVLMGVLLSYKYNGCLSNLLVKSNLEWRWDTMISILQRKFSNTFSLKKTLMSWFKCLLKSFSRVQLTSSQHWCRWWLGAKEATSHHLKLCWPSLLTHSYASLGLNELRFI